MVLAFVGAVLMLVAGLLVGLWGVGKTVLGLVKRRRWVVYRGLALMCGAVAAGGVALGVALVGMAQGEASHGTNSSPAPLCWQARPAQGSHLVGHTVGPLFFECELDDGTSYRAWVVSPWLVPVVVVATAGAVMLAARSGEVRGPSGGASGRYRESAAA